MAVWRGRGGGGRAWGREAARGERPRLGSIVFGSFLAHGESQTFNMGKHLSRSSPATEIETEQLVGVFGRGAAHPQTDEEASNQGHIDLQLHPIFTLTDHMPTAQHTFQPPQ